MKIVTLITIYLTIFIDKVSAQGVDPLGTSDLGLQEIQIPIFPVIFTDLSRYNTVLSWLTFAGGLLVSGVVIFWIAKIIGAGIEAIQAEGDETKIGDARKKVQAALSGIVFTFLVPVVLSFIGIIFGFGTMFEWPKSFSGCTQPNRGDYQYYFQAFAQEPDEATATAVCNPDLANPNR